MPFRYTPLNNPKSDLRVITIQCGQISDSVRCILTEHAMPALKYQYQALSYTWGDERRKVPIIIDGEEFLVTPNLEDALRHLRRSTLLEAVKQLPVWIDAICINQEDSEERDAQVRRMKSIYEQAEQVVIWLGNYNEPSDETFRLNMSKWKMDRDCQHSNNMHVWLQLSRLLYRPWFERLWVIQELAVSRKAIVQWGNLQTAWSTLEKAAKFILRPGEAALPQYIRTIFPLLGAHRVTQVALESMFNFDTQNILTILHNTQNSKCSDPRDRLYAIQGIVEDNQDIEIDYSIPVQQVYRNWAVKRIRRTKTLDIFSACADSSRGGDLPSWVPDFREPFGQDKPLW
ncbi:heterokaryon incompatibility protein-domain-containing protein, partial [Hyaloscypha finlandica]